LYCQLDFLLKILETVYFSKVSTSIVSIVQSKVLLSLEFP